MQAEGKAVASGGDTGQLLLRLQDPSLNVGKLDTLESRTGLPFIKKEPCRWAPFPNTLVSGLKCWTDHYLWGWEAQRGGFGR